MLAITALATATTAAFLPRASQLPSYTGEAQAIIAPFVAASIANLQPRNPAPAGT